MKKPSLFRSQTGGIALLLAATLIAPAVQAQDTASSLHGIVRDDNGPIPLATVAAVDTNSGFRLETTADEAGRFNLGGLRPATYEVTVSSEAYQAQSQTVQIQLGQDVQAEFVLGLSEVFLAEVTVVGDATPLLIDTRGSEVSTNITTRQIEQLPQSSRNFLGFAALAPGVRFTDNQDDAGQKFRGGGADSRAVNVFIDGLSYKNDILPGGAFMQESSRGNPFPQNAVQEFRVLTQNYKAEFEKAASAVITAVTKSGGNEYHGEVFYFLQDKDMVTQDDFAKARKEKEAEYERVQTGLSIGGPIIRDRLHFFASYEENEQDRVSTILRGSAFPTAPANVQSQLSGFQTGSVLSPFESQLFFGKLSWQPGAGQTFEASYHVRDESEVRGFGGQRTLDGAENFEVGTDALVARHTWVLGEYLNEAAVTVQQLQWNPTTLGNGTPRRNFIGILDVGSKDATQNFVQDKIGLRDDVTFATDWHGAHTLKTGLAVNWLDYEITKETFPNGLFEFRSDEAWQFPFQARLGFGNPSLEFSNTQFGIYLQDDWQVRPNFTLNLGVRWDYETNMLNNDFETPAKLRSALESACRTYGQPVGGRTTWCLRDFLDLDRYTTDGNDRDAYTGMIQPRLGFAWDIRGDSKTVLFGGWGQYYDRIVLNDIYDEAYRQQYSIYSFCFSADGSPAPNCGAPTTAWRPEFLSRAGLEGLIARGVTGGPEVFLVPNDLRPTRSTQYTLGVRQQLGSWLTSLSYVGAESNNGIYYFFGDNPPGTAFGDRFGGNVRLDGFGRVFAAKTPGRTWYDAAFLTIDKPFSSNWGLNIAYTYAKAYKNGVDNGGEGVAFGAFDYGSPDDFYKFRGTNDERHRLVVSAMVGLPWGFNFSSLLTLGSGVPFTIFDDSGSAFRVGWNEGSPPKDDFIVSNAWAYRRQDARLEWEAPAIADRVRIGLIAEVFNVFDHDNFGCFDSFKPRSGPSTVGKPNCEFNTRRYQAGARVSF